MVDSNRKSAFDSEQTLKSYYFAPPIFNQNLTCCSLRTGIRPKLILVTHARALSLYYLVNTTRITIMAMNSTSHKTLSKIHTHFSFVDIH